MILAQNEVVLGKRNGGTHESGTAVTYKIISKNETNDTPKKEYQI